MIFLRILFGECEDGPDRRSRTSSELRSFFAVRQHACVLFVDQLSSSLAANAKLASGISYSRWLAPDPRSIYVAMQQTTATRSNPKDLRHAEEYRFHPYAHRLCRFRHPCSDDRRYRLAFYPFHRCRRSRQHLLDLRPPVPNRRGSRAPVLRRVTVRSSSRPCAAVPGRADP